MKKPNHAALRRIKAAKPKAQFARQSITTQTAGTYPMDCKQKRLLKKRLMGQDPYCYWCRVKLSFKTATVDHVLPVYHGGTHEDRNIVLACEPCNKAKGSIYWPLSMKGHRQPSTEAEQCENNGAQTA